MAVGDTTTATGRVKRRNYLVSRGFQLKVAAWIALDVFAVCFLGGVLLISVVEPQVRAQLVNPRVAAGAPMLTLLGFSLAFALVAALAFGAWSILITHRICGPIGVVQRGMEQLGRGEFPRFRALRRKDEFRDFYAAYWRMVHALRSRGQSSASALSAILAAAESGARSGDAASRAAFGQIVAEVRPLVEESRRAEQALRESQKAAPAPSFSAVS